MQTQITGHHVEITDALREFTEKKLQKLSSHVDRITNVHVTFNVDKLRQIAEANVSVPGSMIHAKAESENMYETIDALVDKLMRQLDKYKEKISGHR